MNSNLNYNLTIEPPVSQSPTKSSRRRRINNPELLRLLMDSETRALPRSLTNPAKPNGYELRSLIQTSPTQISKPCQKPLSAALKGQKALLSKTTQAQGVTLQRPIHPQLEQQLDKETKLIVQVLGGAAVLLVTLLLAVSCFAAPTASSIKANAKDSLDQNAAAPKVPGMPSPDVATNPMVENPFSSTSESTVKPLITQPRAVGRPLPTIVSATSRAQGALSRQPATVTSFEVIREAGSGSEVGASKIAVQQDKNHATAVASITESANKPSDEATAPEDIFSQSSAGANKSVVVASAAEMQRLFERAAQSFWDVEPRSRVKLMPLHQTHADRARYQAAGDAALAFVLANDHIHWSKSLARQNSTGKTPANLEEYQPVVLAQAQMQGTGVGSGDEPTEQKALTTHTSASAIPTSLVQEQRANGGSNQRSVATMLYLGGLAYYSGSDFERSRQMLERLRRDHPEYQRNKYISDSHVPDPRYAHPTAPWVTKLLFVMSLKQLPERPEEPLGVLTQFAEEATLALDAQTEYGRWLTEGRSSHDRQYLAGIQKGNPEPDQQRADSLPTVITLLQQQVFDKYVPLAIRKSGRKAVREFLSSLMQSEASKVSSRRALADGSAHPGLILTIRSNESSMGLIPGSESTPLSPIAQLALRQLIALDSTIVEGYFKQSAQLAAQDNFNGARSILRNIIAEYPGTPAAQQAQSEIQYLTSQATAKYRAEGDKKFNPAQQINVPQSEARAYFEKMFKEDPEGPGADYALLQWSRALGTEGNLQQAISQLKSLPEKFGGSEFEAQAKYLIGLYLGHEKVKKYDEAIVCLEEVAAAYPDSPEAPESLWHAAYFCYLGKQPEKGGQYLDALAKYTDSPRFRHIGEMRSLLKPAG